MSGKDLKFIEKKGIDAVWLMEVDFPSFKRFLCSKNMTSQEAEQLKIVRRKFQLRKYRLENYCRKKVKLSELQEEKRSLEVERVQLNKEIENLKTGICLLDFMCTMDELEIKFK